jgi:subfamily B ATP-binding cassette protein MsbA
MREYFRLTRFLRPYKWHLVLSFVLIVLFSISNAISIYLSIPLLRTLFTGEKTEIVPSVAGANINWFDNLRLNFELYIFGGNDKYTALVRVCMLLLVFYLSKNFFGYLQSILTEYIQKSLITDLRRKLYHKFNSLSLKYYSEKKSGDIISRFIADVNTIQNMVAVTFTDLIKQPVLLIVFLTMAFLISWKLTLISLLIIPLSLVLIIYVGRKLRKYSTRVQEKLGEFTSVIAETIYGSKIIRAFSMEEFENRRFERKLKDYFRSMMKNSIYSDLTGPMTEYISVIIGVFIIWYGGKEIFLGNTLQPEEFIGFLIIVFQLMSPIKDISSVNNRVQESSAAANRLFQILDADPEIFDTPESIEINGFNDSIEFRNVTFRYDSDDKIVLDNINLSIKKNEQIAIVGLSGVGKSTLVDLLPRFYDPTEGEILIDNVNIKKIKLKSLRDLFGFVTQEIILFNDTIRNNIAYGYEDMPMEKIIEAAKNANAHSFIMETEKGYNTVIGERGIKLSGGQRQRIAIARALLKNAPIMIFDEATSSLDTESESLIQEAIERLIKNNTSIVIAHRLSTIRDADRIIVIHNGKVDSIGSHEKLMESEEGIYKKLYELQFS